MTGSPLGRLSGSQHRVWGPQDGLPKKKSKSHLVERPRSPHEVVPELKQHAFQLQLEKDKFDASGPASDLALSRVYKSIMGQVEQTGKDLTGKLQSMEEKHEGELKTVWKALGEMKNVLTLVSKSLTYLVTQESPQMKAYRAELIVSEQGVSEELKKTQSDIEQTKEDFEHLRTRARFIRKAVEHISMLFQNSQKDTAPIKVLKEIQFDELEKICRSSKESLKELEKLESDWAKEIPKQYVGKFRKLEEWQYKQLRTDSKSGKDYASLKEIKQAMQGIPSNLSVSFAVFSEVSEEFYSYLGGTTDEKNDLLLALFANKARWKAIQLEGKLSAKAVAAIKEKGKSLYQYVKTEFEKAEKATQNRSEPQFNLKTFHEVLAHFNPDLGNTALSTLASIVRDKQLKPLEAEAKTLLTTWKQQKDEAERLIRDQIGPRIEKGSKITVTDEIFNRINDSRREDLLVSKGPKNGACVEVLSAPKNSSKNQFERYGKLTEDCIKYKTDLEALMASIQDPKENGERYNAGKMLYELKKYLERGCSPQGLLSWAWNVKSKPKYVLKYFNRLIDVTDSTSKAVTVNGQKRGGTDDSMSGS